MTDNADHGARPAGAVTVLLTRPRSQSEAFAQAITARLPDAMLVLSPLMEIVAEPGRPNLEASVSVIFTSANGVAAAGPGHGRRAWCVGERTTQVASGAGYTATFAGGTAEELIAHLVALRPSEDIVHLHGRHTRGKVAERLRMAGLNVSGRAIYEQVAIAPAPAFFEALAACPLIVPLFSPRSARLFSDAAAPETRSPDMRLVALSPAVFEALPEAWRQTCIVARRPDATAMLDGIAQQVYP